MKLFTTETLRAHSFFVSIDFTPKPHQNQLIEKKLTYIKLIKKLSMTLYDLRVSVVK